VDFVYFEVIQICWISTK